VGDAARLIRTGWQRLVSAVLDCEKPVIAAVNATAAGGGMHLALACDLVIAAEESKFIEVFIRRGIAPDAGGAYLLARLIGPQRAKELFFFGDDVPAVEAERLGLVNRVVPRDRLLEEAGAWAERLAAAPTKAISVTKYLTNRALESDRTTALWDEAVGQELVTGTEDCREGLAAFAERRPPVFRGW
jgi:2-(1,2-epoxy-1,2-dihydrophenyl)acetyl-CoA isomerase